MESFSILSTRDKRILTCERNLHGILFEFYHAKRKPVSLRSLNNNASARDVFKFLLQIVTDENFLTLSEELFQIGEQRRPGGTAFGAGAFCSTVDHREPVAGGIGLVLVEDAEELTQCDPRSVLVVGLQDLGATEGNPEESCSTGGAACRSPW
jgi:hypothetical protein